MALGGRWCQRAFCTLPAADPTSFYRYTRYVRANELCAHAHEVTTAADRVVDGADEQQRALVEDREQLARMRSEYEREKEALGTERGQDSPQPSAESVSAATRSSKRQPLSKQRTAARQQRMMQSARWTCARGR